MQTVFSVLLRLVLLAAGLVFAASLLLVAAMLMAAWGLRAVWCQLMGQPVTPFVMRVDPRGGFRQTFRARADRPASGAEAAQARGLQLGGRAGDIDDVEAKPPRD